MRALSLIFLLALVGSATKPLPASSATPVEADRLLAFQTASPDMGVLVVTRDVGYIGSRCMRLFMVNGTPAARFAAGETATFHVPPGELLLRYATDPQGGGLCGRGDWTQRERSISAGETKHFRLTLTGDALPDNQRADS